MQKARGEYDAYVSPREGATPDPCRYRRDIMDEGYAAALDEIERLQRIIAEPVESFGTPELIEWANGLQKIIADYPENERGGLSFVMRMGCHLEKFAKSWNASRGGEAMSQLFDEDDAARILGIIEQYLVDCDCPECKADVALMLRFQDAVIAASRPAWEVTEERKATIRYALAKIAESDFRDPACQNVLRAMLEEAGP
jgi:hypothetical protein